jgi:septal ring factor EnvC (AmiA/AmiB activator)
MAGPNDLRALDTSSVSPRADPLKTPVKSRSNTISVKTDAKSFDVFLSSVAKVQSLTEAKRLRNDVDREIRALKNTASLSSIEEQRRKEEAHLKRLEKARRKIEKRIERLQGKSPSVSRHTSQFLGCAHLFISVARMGISQLRLSIRLTSPLFVKSSMTHRLSFCLPNSWAVAVNPM